jgi:hypothetical protein
MANQGFRSRGSANPTAIRADHVVHFVDGAGGVPIQFPAVSAMTAVPGVVIHGVVGILIVTTIGR